MLRERPGNVVVFSGRNGSKIERVAASVTAGLNVLADKPWILESADLGRLEETLAEADRSGVVAYDIMTERFEVTSILQRALVNDPAVFGEMLKGTEDDPARVHGERPLPAEAGGGRAEHQAGVVLRQHAAGRRAERRRHPSRRPGPVDAVSRTVDRLPSRHPGAAAQRWATPIDEAGFSRVTGERGFPAAFASALKDGRFDTSATRSCPTTLRGTPSST